MSDDLVIRIPRQGGFPLDIDITMPAKGIIGIFGPSGSGKTTLLRCIAGLMRAADARIHFLETTWQQDKSFVPPHLRRIGMVFQDADPFPHLSVAQNLAYGFTRAAPSDRRIGMDQVVSMLALEGLLSRMPQTLSGGERQRVAIGRALLSQPRLLIFDEPTSALDRTAATEIVEYIDHLCRTLGLPALYVTHDLAEMGRVADRMILLGEGRIQAAGATADLLTDLDLSLTTSPESGAIFEAVVAGDDSVFGLTSFALDGGALLIPHGGGTARLPGMRCRLRVMASDVSLCRVPPQDTTILNALEGIIVEARPFREYQMNVVVRLGAAGTGDRMLARITRKSWHTLGFAAGDRVCLLVKGASLVDAFPG